MVPPIAFPVLYALLIAVAVTAGTVCGNLTLLQATAIADRWGTTHYGRLSGLLTAPAAGGSALAPFAGAALAGPLGRYLHLFLLLSLISAISALTAAAATPSTDSDARPNQATGSNGSSTPSSPTITISLSIRLFT